MNKILSDMINFTDMFPWYWYSYGGKCYAFAVVSAYPLEIGVEYPEPGSQLKLNEEGNLISKNGVIMIVEQEISRIENQNGDTICAFIAYIHSVTFKDRILTHI